MPTEGTRRNRGSNSEGTSDLLDIAVLHRWYGVPYCPGVHGRVGVLFEKYRACGEETHLRGRPFL